MPQPLLRTARACLSVAAFAALAATGAFAKSPADAQVEALAAELTSKFIRTDISAVAQAASAQISELEESDEAKDLANARALFAELRILLARFQDEIRRAATDLHAQCSRAVASELRDRFDDSEVATLLAFLRNPISDRYLAGDTPTDAEFAAGGLPASEVDRLRDGLISRAFAAARDPLVAFSESAKLRLAEITGAFESDIDALVERLDPLHVFSEPLYSTDPAAPIGLLAEPAPAVAAYLARNGLGAPSLELVHGDDQPRIGDRITALVSYADGALERQWILQVESVPMTPDEARKFAETVNSETWHTSLGNEYVFESSLGAVEIATIGPFATRDDARVQNPPREVARTVLNTQFLTLGVDGLAELLCRMRDIAREDAEATPWTYSYNRIPFDAEAIEASRASVARFEIAPEEDRAMAGATLPLWQFLWICNKTRPLREILGKVVKLPTPMTILANRFEARYRFDTGPIERFDRVFEHAPTGAETLYSYPIILSIYEEPSLYLRFFASEPTPPMHLASGFYGVVASTPDKPERRLAARVIDTRRGVAPSD